MPSLRDIAPGLAVLAAVASAAAAAALALGVDRKLAHLERLATPAQGDAAALATDAASVLLRADRAHLAGDARVAVALYEQVLAAAGPDEPERLAAQLGLARASARLGDEGRARRALEAATIPRQRPRLPAELCGWAEQAVAAGAWADARRLLWGALALEDGPHDEESARAIAWAPLRLGDARRAEAGLGAPARRLEGGAGKKSAGRPWAAWLAAVDSSRTPALRVERQGEALLVSVEAEQAEARDLLAQLAARSGLDLPLPELPATALSAKLVRRPLPEALLVLAGAAGLDLIARPGEPLRLELPSPPGPDGIPAARARAAEAYRLGLRRGGPAAERVQLELAELERASDHQEEAAGLYRLLTGAADAQVRQRALLGLARCEAALLRFPAARDPLFKLVKDESARDLAPEALLLVAETYGSEGRDGEAEKALRHLVDAFRDVDGPTVGLARLRLGRILAAAGKHELALEALRAAAKGLPGPERIDATCAAAASLLELDRAGEAVGLLTPLLAGEETARSAAAYLLLAEAAHRTGDHLAALFALRHVEAAHGATAEARSARRLLVRELAEIGLLDQAALELEDGPSAARRELAEASLAQDEVGRARLLLAGSTDPASLLLLARCDLAAGDPRGALERLEPLGASRLGDAERSERARLVLLAEQALGRPGRAAAAFEGGKR